MNKNTRSASLDLIRCLAMLLVIIYHSFVYNGYYFCSQSGFSMWLANGIRSLSISCIGLFIMLTGYLQSPKTDIQSCYRRLFPVIVCYLLSSVICIPVRHFLFGITHTVAEWIEILLQIGTTPYSWFVLMYLGLTLLSPFLNIAIKNLSNKGLLLFAGILILITALPGATPLNWINTYWQDLYPITFYVLGAAIRRLQPNISPWIGILCAITMAFLMGTITLLSTNQALAQSIKWQFQDLPVVFIVVCLFLSLYNISIPSYLLKPLSFSANGCLGACLLSYLLDYKCYLWFPIFRTPSRYILLFFCVSVPIYIISIFAGHYLQKCANLCAKWLRKAIALLPSKALDHDITHEK